MDIEDGISTFTLIFDGKGGSTEIEGKQTVKKNSSWQNFDYTDQEAIDMLSTEYKLEDEVIQALTELQTRPRYFLYDGGMLVIIRGMDGSSGAKNSEMVSLRIWIDAEKIITFSHKKIKGFDTVLNRLKKGKGPKTPMECFMQLATSISEETEKEVDHISYKVDLIEADVIRIKTNKNNAIRAIISGVRRRIVTMRRYLVPNRDVFSNLRNENIINKNHKVACREVYNTFMKAIEDLDYAREHLAVSYEELQGHVSMRISQIMYKISIVTIIFMPMSVLTSLLGVNVNGIPFAEESYAFGVLFLMLISICLLLVFIFRRLKWI